MRAAHLERLLREYAEHCNPSRPHLSWEGNSPLPQSRVAEQADADAEKARAILTLYAELKARALELTCSQFAVPLLDQLFARPIVQSRHLKFGKKPPSAPAVANLLRASREAAS